MVGLYLCLAIAIVLITELGHSGGDFGGWWVLVWVGAVVWWGLGSQIARAILLAAGVLTAVAFLLVEPEGTLASDTIVLTCIAVLQIVVLCVWKRS